MLLTKLNIPSTGRNLVQRSDLFDQLNEGLKRKLILISAPAGFGIMNIMLVSVIERTREIGIRMAVGARPRDILRQFLIEAMALSLAGGILGVSLGIGITLLVADLAGWQSYVSIFWGLIAFFFSAFVGIFFGFYPALKASRLDPIDALRYE